VPPKLLIVGLDCLGSDILEPPRLARLPNLAACIERGVSGPLESTMPPITIPAWTSMMTGRDPGELGIYGFRNRASYDYEDLFFAGSAIRYPRIWDRVHEQGASSIVVGVPQTSPPPSFRGVCVSGFEAESLPSVPCCSPRDALDRAGIRRADYHFDVEDYRRVSRREVLTAIHGMTRRRFDLMRRLLRDNEWSFAMLCEIGSDRMHHCFWRHHDPAHPAWIPNSKFAGVIDEYYELLDVELGRLLDVAGPDCMVAIVSDHGVRAMQGGICVNEVLRRAGWLVLRENPATPRPLRARDVDWSATRAWAEGGYYARVMLNVEGREPEGIVPGAEISNTLHELSGLFADIALADGLSVAGKVHRPSDLYRSVRGHPPDLIVVFDDFSWRSIGTVGHDPIWMRGNDTGPDDANHSMHGVYVLCAPGAAPGHRQAASIYDIAPTACSLLGLPSPNRARGRSLVG